MNSTVFCRTAAVAAFISSFALIGAHAQPPGTTAAGVLDLAPGPDVHVPRHLAINSVTDRLYVGGWPSSGQSEEAIKVIDTATKKIIGGVNLGRYANSINRFLQFAIAVDPSAAPLGNKIYVLGQLDGPKFVLRVIDGATNQNLTGEGTDLILPAINRVENLSDLSRIVVNPNNHKVYIADGFGNVLVIDGARDQPKVITTLKTDAGNFLVLSPVSNKVFVMGHNSEGVGKPGVVIDSATDTFKAIPTAMPNANAAAFNPANNRVYFSGRVDQRIGIFVLDGENGELVMENTQNVPWAYSLAVSPSRNAIFVGGYEYAADTLEFRREIVRQRHSAVTDVEGGDDVFFLHDYGQAASAVTVVDLATLNRTQITVGYRPLGMAANSGTDRLYVTDAAAAELLVLQASSGDVTARVPLEVAGPPSSDAFATQPRSVAVSERLNRVYVPRSGANRETPVIDVLDGATNQVRSSIAVPGMQPDAPVAVDDTRRRIYVGLIEPASPPPFVRYPYGRIKVAVYDAGSETLVDTIYLTDGGGWPSVPKIAVNPVLGRLYAVHGRTMATIDTTTNVVVGSETVPAPSSIAVDKRTGKVFVSIIRSTSPSPQASDTRIAVLNGLTGELETEFAPGGEYFGVRTFAVDEVGNRLYATQTTSGPDDFEPRPHRITAYDANTYEPLGEHTSLDARNMVFDPGSRRLFVVGTSQGTIDIFQSTTAAEPDLLGNISTRGFVSEGDGALIGGFIIKGAPGATKKVAIRAIGPSLGAAGIAGAVSDTTLELHDSAGNIVRNDDWKVDTQSGASQEDAVAASGLAPTSELESLLLAALPPGPCTAVVRGKNGAAGVALVEVYDLEQGASASMANIATRGNVGTGENVMIGGLIVVGSNPTRVLVRAIGPSLPAAIATALQDPVLELRDVNGELIDLSDDWKAGREREIAETTIPPVHDRESAIVATLYPGNYTAIVRGKDGTTGIALVEAYHLTR